MQSNWLEDLDIPINLTSLSDAGACLSHEHQLHLADVFGEHKCEVDLSVPCLSVTGDHPLTCAAHLLGTAAPGPRSWLWSWANRSPGFAPAASALAAQLRGFGLKHSITELTRAELPFSSLPGAPEEPGAAVWALVNASKAASQIWTAYTFQAGGGTRVALLIEHPDFHLPPPSGPRVMLVLTEVLAGAVRIVDHRLAVRGYAAGRGLDAAWSDRAVTLSGPGMQVVVEFDERGRTVKIGGQLRGT